MCWWLLLQLINLLLYESDRSIRYTDSVPKKSSLRVRSACSAAWCGAGGSARSHAAAGSIYISGVKPANDESSASRTGR